MRNHSPFFLIVISLALVSWWLVKLTGSDEIERHVVPKHSVDYYSIDYVKLEMDVQGKPKSKILAEMLEHYSDDGKTHLQKPVMTFFNARTPPWIIHAETGILTADRKNVLLNGKVIVDRAAKKGVRHLTINTSNARVQPDISYAETDEWAELISPPHVTTGIGMELYFSEPLHLKLLSNVKGKYLLNE